MRYREYSHPDAVPTKLYKKHPKKPNVYLPVHKRPLRHQEMDYRSSECLCFVTFNVHPECNVRFVGEIAKSAWAEFWQTVQEIGCHVFAACLMPDHMHLLIAPSGQGETVSGIVKRIKGRLTAKLRRQFQIHLRWQKSFYDHVLRSEERQPDAFEAIKQYIYENPERVGLGSDYPFRYK